MFMAKANEFKSKANGCLDSVTGLADGLEGETEEDLNPALLLSSCVTSDKLLCLPGPRFFHL